MKCESRVRTSFRVGIGCAAATLLFLPGCAESVAPPKAHVPSTAEQRDREDTPTPCAKIHASGEMPLIDDFEALPDRILRNDGRDGWWFSYDDGTGGRLLREEIELTEGDEKGHALHVVSSGFEKWGASVALNLHPQTTQSLGCAYDASAYSGVRVRARGRGRLRVLLGDAATTPAAAGGICTRSGKRCYDRPGVWLILGEQWKTYEFPFCAFLPEGWGGSADGIDPSTLFHVHFRVPVRETAEFWLDDLTFYHARATDAAPQCGRPCPLDLVPPSTNINPTHCDAALTEELSLHTFEQNTKSCGTITRRYLSYVPSQLPPRSSAPVLFVLHGIGGNAETARSYLTRSRFDVLAKRDHFIVVYGNAAPGAHTNARFPNSGGWRQGHLDDGQVDDVDYLERVLSDLAARGIISTNNPVFLTGLSNGGGMVLEAARHLSHRISGLAALMPYDGDRPKPVPDLANTKLKRVLFAYTHNDPAMPDKYHETVARLPAQWARAMGLPAAVIAAPRETLLPDVIVEGKDYQGKSPVALATRNSRVTQLDMIGPGGKGQVRVLVMDHAGHFWPSPTQFAEEWILNRYGFCNQDIDAADTVWGFLRGAAE